MDRWWPWTHQNLLADPAASAAFSRGGSLFRPPERQLRPAVALVDARLLSGTADPRVRYLLELAAVEPVEGHLVAPDGAPRGGRRLVSAEGAEAHGGWVELAPSAGGVGARFCRGGVPTVAVARWGPAPAAWPPDAATVLALAADAARADLVVSGDPAVLAADPARWRTATVLAPGQALPVLGLYLRAQGRFVLGGPRLGSDARPRPPSLRSRADFWWAAAEALVPSAGDWKGTGLRRRLDAGDAALEDLSASLPWRVGQALRTRDRLLLLQSAPADADAVDAVASELDVLLVLLMAAVDVAARIAHSALRIETEVWEVGWQRKKWIGLLRKKAPALADLVRDGTGGHQLLTVLREARNTVHGAAPEGRGYVVGPFAREPLVVLPGEALAKALPAMEALGGAEAWGAVSAGPGAEVLLRPGAFAERLLPRVLLLVEALLAATPSAGAEPGGIDLRARHLPVAAHEERTVRQLGLDPDQEALFLSRP